MTFPRALTRYTHGAVNKMTLHLAGHAAFADLEHASRESGIVRHTPVRAFRAGDTVLISIQSIEADPAAAGSLLRQVRRQRRTIFEVSEVINADQRSNRLAVLADGDGARGNASVLTLT